MKGTLLARVQSVRLGHSERALVHAVDDDGREHKLEVPVESVRDLPAEGELVLMLAWSLHALPRIAAPATAAAPSADPRATATEPASPPSESASPSAIDQEFMALLSRGRTSAASPPAAPTRATASATTQDFAQLLGLHLGVGPRRA